MPKPVVDYREFRLNRLNDPRFSHLKLLFGWVGDFVLYFLTENLIPVEKCHPMHCVVDDWIPFCEFFVIFYVFWYVLVAGSLLNYALYDPDSFRKLQTFIIITQAVGMITYILYPSRQDLRPEVFDRNNVFTWVMGIIYGFDTSTGVCPSLHVAYSLGILSVCWKDEKLAMWKKLGILLSVILISLATMFVKQHSAVDVGAALILGLVTEAVVYGKYWIKKWKRS